MIAFAIMGAVNWIAKWFDPAGPATSEQIGDAFADYLVGGLLNGSRVASFFVLSFSFFVTSLRCLARLQSSSTSNRPCRQDAASAAPGYR